MGSGGTTALLPPGKFCFIRPLLRSDLICIRLKILSHPPKQPSCHSPFRLRNCWEGRSVRASSLLRQLAKGGCAARRLSWVTPGFSQSRRCKTTASAKLACRSTLEDPGRRRPLSGTAWRPPPAAPSYWTDGRPRRPYGVRTASLPYSSLVNAETSAVRSPPSRLYVR